MKLFTKEYIIDDVRIVDGPFGLERVNTYKQVTILNKSAAAIYGGVLVLIAVLTMVGALVFGGSNTMDAAADTMVDITVDTVVDTTVDTTPVMTMPVVEEVIPVAPVPQYVCDMPATSNEYAFLDDAYVWQDGVKRKVSWKATLKHDVVMLWAIDDEAKFADFINDIAMFNTYTRANVRVERYGYIGKENDFIVPVVIEDLEGLTWAHMENHLQAMNLFGIDITTLKSAKLAFDPEFMTEHWDVHTHTVLHEMGHMFGLDHTHEQEGEQTDSIMSYESDYTTVGYLPGDIAGLQKVFCDR